MKNILFLFFLGAGLLSIGCRKKNEDPYLRFSQKTFSVPPMPGGTLDLVIESNITWTIATNSDWLQLNKTTGKGKDTVRMTVISGNTDTGPRTATITAVATGHPDMEMQATVEQRPYNLQLLERKTLGGNFDEFAAAIVATTDGGHVIVGHTSSSNSGQVRTNHGEFDYWVVRLNSNHDTLWTRVLGGAGRDEAKGVAATPDGGFVVVGFTSIAGSGDVPAGYGENDIWLVKLTSNGNIAWTRILGGSAYDMASAVAVTPEGNIMVAGKTLSSDIAGNVGVNHGGTDMLGIKLTADGETVWARTLGGSGYEECLGATIAQDGGIVMVGATGSSNSGDVTGTNQGGQDSWTVRLSRNGDIIWSRIIGGTGYEVLHAATVASDGGFVATGYTGSKEAHLGVNKGGFDCMVLKLKSNGDREWARQLGGSSNDYAHAIITTTDGGFLMAGLSGSSNGDAGTNRGDFDCFIAKLDADGQKNWAASFGGNREESFSAIAKNQNGSFTLAAQTYSSNNGDVNTTNNGFFDWWMVSLKDH